MDFHQLKVFYSAVSTGSFTRASQTLNLSQSTISQHIKQLESELGCHLFRRVGRGVHLTEAGYLLRDHCEKIFQDVKNAEMAIKELNGLQRGRIRFGSGATTLIYQLPAVIEAFSAQFPNIELVIFSDTTEAILREIKAQRLDLGLVMKPPAENDLQFTPLCDEELMIAVSSKHPLANKRALTIQDLQELRFILYEKKTVMRKLIDDFFSDLGVIPQIAMVMENIEAIKSLVGAGLGASVLPAHAVGNDAVDKKVRMIRVQKRTLRRQLGLVMLKSGLPPKAVYELSQLIVNELRKKNARQILNATAIPRNSKLFPLALRLQTFLRLLQIVCLDVFALRQNLYVREHRSSAESGWKYAHLAVPVAAVVILFVLLVPLPPLLLDVLISFNLMLSVIVLLAAIYILQPVKFTSFPNLLLLTTLYRLALNVATTRLILSRGEAGEDAAGTVIKAFGEFVIGGNYVVGAVIFLVLLAIQFLVVNHGAVRSSEVMARFTLDAMPGKQMAVDADLAAGIIDEHEAKRRRADIGQAAEFHGAMDGAIRFTQRDAVAAIIITVINVIAGFAIGILQHNMPIVEALKTYTMLTVGDGVAAAVASLMISVAAALITTRAATEVNMGEEMSSQLLLNPRPLFIAACVLGALGLMPGMPHLAFLTLAAAAGGAAYLAQQQQSRVQVQEESRLSEEAKAKAASSEQGERIESLLRVDALALEVGYGLIPMISAGDSFLSRVREIRRQIAMNLGIVVPPIHVTDNLQLAPREYAILLKGERIAQGELYPDGYLAIDPGAVREQIDGITTQDPTFGMPAVWVRRSDDRERAMAAGYTVVDPTTVVCTHLSELIKRYSPDLLGRQETRALLDSLGETHPKTVEEATPKVLTLGDVQRVLQSLLRERVPIRDLATILEAITDAGSLSRDVNVLAEAARTALSRTICAGLSNEQGELVVLTLDPTLEREIADRLGLLGGAPTQAIEPDFGRRVLEKIETAVQSAILSQPVILCSSSIRPHLRRLTERFLPDLSVVAHGEVSANVRLVSVGAIA